MSEAQGSLRKRGKWVATVRFRPIDGSATQQVRRFGNSARAARLAISQTLAERVDHEPSAPSGEFDLMAVLDEHIGRQTETYLPDDLSQLSLTVELIDHLFKPVVEGLLERRVELNPDATDALDQWVAMNSTRESARLELFKREMEKWDSSDEDVFWEALTPNWNHPIIQLPDKHLLNSILVDEGIQVAWVPPNDVLQLLLSTKSSDSRRLILEMNADLILDACHTELSRLRRIEIAEWVFFAQEAAGAMQAGMWAAGQALAVNTLETLMRRFSGDNNGYRALTGARDRVGTRPGTESSLIGSAYHVQDDAIRGTWVLNAIWGAYGRYTQGDFTDVPTELTRHGSAHAVSSSQYGKVNAIKALMHAVALLCLVEDR